MYMQVCLQFELMTFELMKQTEKMTIPLSTIAPHEKQTNKQKTNKQQQQQKADHFTSKSEDA